MTTREGVYIPGDYYLDCDVCGFKRRRSEAVERWDGAMVCAPHVKGGCYEAEHPLDHVQIPREEPRVLQARHPEPVYVDQDDWAEDWASPEYS